MTHARRIGRAPRPRFAAVAVVSVALAAALASCGSQPVGTIPKGRVSTTVGVELGQGGTVRVAVTAVPTNLNPGTPAGDSAVARMVMDEVWPSPFLIGRDLQPTPSSTFVTSAELVRLNPQTVVYQINSQARWSDGVPISISDFVYNWHARAGLVTDPNGVAAISANEVGYDDIASITGSPRSNVVTVQFAHPFADWESLFSDLVPAHVAERVGWNSGFTTFSRKRFVSGGPFEITGFDPGVSITLSRNPLYWGQQSRLDQIVIEAVSNQARLASLLAHGQIDAAWAPATAPLLAMASGLPHIYTSIEQSDRIEEIDFNLLAPDVAQVAVRQAVASALDRTSLAQAMTEAIGGGGNVADNHLAVPGEIGYQGGGGAAYAKPDPARVARLLASVGDVLGPSGEEVAAGPGSTALRPVVLRMLVDTADPFTAGITAAVRLALHQVGIGLDVVQESGSAFRAALVPGGPWDMALVSMHADPYPSVSAARYVTKGEGNDTGLADPHVDNLVSMAEQQLDPIRAATEWGAVDQAVWATMASIPLFVPTDVVAWTSKLVNVKLDEGPPGLLWKAGAWGLLVPKPQKSTGTGNNAATGRPATRTNSGTR